jgi:hypothetical protein
LSRLVSAAFVAAASAAACGDWRRLATGDYACSGGTVRAGFVARTRPEFAAFASRLEAEDRARVGRANFRREAVVAVFRCFPTGGYRIQIDGIRRQRDRLIVSFSA